MPKLITKDEFVALFQEIGLSDAQMERWHRLFEQRHPEEHQAFLEGLGIAATEIEEIRQRYA